MKDRPILMSGPMVRARLAGRKNQTRRECTHPLLKDLSSIVDCGDGWWGDEEGDVQVRCPYGQPGDRLWVREAFRFPESIDHLSPTEIGEKALAVGYPKPWCPIQFEADGLRRTPQEWRDFVTPPQANEAGRLRAGMHMPRWASRITLDVTGVRVERLQDISETDAVAEGIESIPSLGKPGSFQWCDYRLPNQPSEWFNDPVRSYQTLWEEINGPGSWDLNPLVWVVEFA